MPRKRPSLADIYASASALPSFPPPPSGLDESKLDELRRKAQAAFQDFLRRLRNLPLDPQVKSELAGSVLEALCCKDEIYCLEVRWLQENCNWLFAKAKHFSSRVENQRKGPRLKRERVQKRHEEIDRARAAGITDDEGLFRFMQEHHPDLIRIKKRFISAKQMMREYRAARRPWGP